MFEQLLTSPVAAFRLPCARQGPLEPHARYARVQKDRFTFHLSIPTLRAVAMLTRVSTSVLS